MGQLYRFHVGNGLRQKSHRLGEFTGPEIRSEEFDSDEEFCLAVATELLETIKQDREYIDSTREIEGEDD